MSDEAQSSLSNTTLPDELTLQIAALLRSGLGNNAIGTGNSDNLSVEIKLGNDNYPLWARLMQVAIGGKGKASDTNLPEEDTYELYQSSPEPINP